MNLSLEALRLVHPNAGPAALIELRAWGASAHRSWHETAEDVYGQALVLSDDHDVYVGVAPRVGKGGTAEHVEGLSCLWADLDCRDGMTKAGRLAQLDELSVSPQVVVDSGNGLHAYWLLDEVVEPEHGREVMAMLADGLGGDPVGDPARVLRVPGTLNHKGEPVPVNVVRLVDERVPVQVVEAMACGLTPPEGAEPAGSALTVEIVYDAALGRATSFAVR